MPFPSDPLTSEHSPILRSPFVQHWCGEGINPPPPGTALMITEGGEYMLTENTNNLMVTE